MKFSIVIPVFNTEDFLEECLDSVLNQSYTWYEIVLVDDGSTDGSGRLCDEYASRYPDRIKPIHINNSGPLIARQKGINSATGDFILFMDSDDCIREDALEILAEIFENKDCDMVLFNLAKTETFGEKDIRYPFADGCMFDNKTKEIIYTALVLSEIPNAVWIKAIRRHCLDSLPDFRNMPHVRNQGDKNIYSHSEHA